jgi:hypothetical protein
MFEGCECLAIASEDYAALYDHTRQLERELTAMTHERDKWATDHMSLQKQLTAMTARWQAADKSARDMCGFLTPTGITAQVCKNELARQKETMS